MTHVVVAYRAIQLRIQVILRFILKLVFCRDIDGFSIDIVCLLYTSRRIAFQNYLEGYCETSATETSVKDSAKSPMGGSRRRA